MAPITRRAAKEAAAKVKQMFDEDSSVGADSDNDSYVVPVEEETVEKKPSKKLKPAPVKKIRTRKKKTPASPKATTPEETSPAEDNTAEKSTDAVTKTKKKEKAPKVVEEFRPQGFLSQCRYRTNKDIVARTIMSAGSEGIDRVDIGKRLAINARTKGGNRRVSELITNLLQANPDGLGKFERMEGRQRIAKFYFKGSGAAPAAFADHLLKIEQLTGQKFPYSAGDSITFTGKKLPPLRVSDVTLRRFLFALELFHEDGIIVQSAALRKYIAKKESEVGYQYEIDKKSTQKILYALEQKQFLRILSMKYVGEPAKTTKKAPTLKPATEEEEFEPVASTSTAPCPPMIPVKIEEPEKTPKAAVPITYTIDLVVPWEIESTDDPRVAAAIEREKKRYDDLGQYFPAGIPTPKYYEIHGVKKDKKSAPQPKKKRAPPKEKKEKAPKPVKMKTKRVTRAKKTQDVDRDLDAPILTQRTLDALTGANRVVRKRRSATDSVLEAANALLDENQAPKRKRRSRKRDADQDETTADAEGPSSPRASKRKPDAIDLQSTKLRTGIRARFNAREYDMLVLIRSVGYFLNPIHRFWISPTVMRDIMHEYVPESRNKTVSSLLAASARELSKEGRAAQLQQIVNTLTTSQDMIEIRDKFATNTLKTDKEKSTIFWQAFEAAHKLLFNEPDTMPPYSVDDETFRAFMAEKGLQISVSEPSERAIFPRRSRKPQTVDDIQHCVAFNAIMAVLTFDACRPVEEQNASQETGSYRLEVLANNISLKAISETLEICRAGGLITKKARDQSKRELVLAQMAISLYYRHFFNHGYRYTIIELIKQALTANDDTLFMTQEDNPAALIRLLDCFSDPNQRLLLDVNEVTEVIDRFGAGPQNTDGKKKYYAIKHSKQLDSIPLRLEKIEIRFPANGETVNVPNREDVLPIIGPVYSVNSVTEEEFLNELLRRIAEDPEFGKEVTVEKAFSVLVAIDAAKYEGATVDELKKATDLSSAAVDALLDLFSRCGIAFACGVDVKRYVGLSYSQPWLIKTETNRFTMRPWTLADGSVNWTIVRWMCESILLTVHYKVGISEVELQKLYAYVLMPTLVSELVEFLVKIGCFVVPTESLGSLKVPSPFAEQTTTAEKHIKLAVNGLTKFAAFFIDTPLMENPSRGKTGPKSKRAIKAEELPKEVATPKIE